MMSKVHQGHEKLLAGQAKLEDAIRATQRMLVEYGDTPVPRMAVLVPVDLAKSQSKPKDFFGRLAFDAGVVKYYDLFFVLGLL